MITVRGCAEAIAVIEPWNLRGTRHAVALEQTIDHGTQGHGIVPLDVEIEGAALLTLSR
jgi:hypothetical protein